MKHSDWTYPIVAVHKKDGGFHISGDYKVMVNGALDCDYYRFPNRSELFAILASGKTFTESLTYHIPFQTPVNCLYTSGGQKFTKLDLT